MKDLMYGYDLNFIEKKLSEVFLKLYGWKFRV